MRRRKQRNVQFLGHDRRFRRWRLAAHKHDGGKASHIGSPHDLRVDQTGQKQGSILGKGQKTDDQRFTQLHQVVEAVAQSQADQIDRFSASELERQQDKAAIQQLTSELNALRGQLQLQPAENYSARPAATGNSSAQLADF